MASAIECWRKGGFDGQHKPLQSGGNKDSAVLAIAVLACAGRARGAQLALRETVMKRLRQKTAALEETNPL